MRRLHQRLLTDASGHDHPRPADASEPSALGELARPRPAGLWAADYLAPALASPALKADANAVALAEPTAQGGGVSEDLDRLLIHELINLHGHVMDDGAFQRLDELFTADVRYDVSALGGGCLEGRSAIEAAGRALGDGNPLGHHVTNIVVTSISGDAAAARSKGLAVMADGTAGSVTYEDQLRRTPDGWRIAVRRVLPRRKPLHAAT